MSIWSRQEVFQNIRFVKPRSGQVYKAESVAVAIDGSRRSIVVKLANGKGYISNVADLEQFAIQLDLHWWAKTHLRALKALGMITQEHIDLEEKHGVERVAAEKRGRAARDLKRSLEVSGLKPTKAQARFIAANRKN